MARKPSPAVSISSPPNESRRPLRRADQIGEENRCEHTVGRSDRTHASEELLDLVEDLVRVDEGDVIAASELDETSSSNVLCEIAALLHLSVEITGAVNDEGRALHGRQGLANVRLRVHQDEIAGTRRTQ
jgi:hypothetical protein